MRVSLKTRVTILIASVIIAISAITTLYFSFAQEGSLDREITARGVTLAESLARGVTSGLAEEDLDFLKQVEDIVHTRDVSLAQVYSSLWMPVDSYPAERQDVPPDPAAIAFYKKETNEGNTFSKEEDAAIDFYAPVRYNTEGSGKKGGATDRGRYITIGYVRLTLSTEAARRAVAHTVAVNLLVSASLTLLAVLILNAFIRRYVLKPVLALHGSVSRHRTGEFPEAVPVTSGDEIGELSAEFNSMSIALRERGERLAEEKERLAVTLRSIGDAVIVTDLLGTITLLNRVAEQHTGWTADEAVGRPLAEVFHIINEKTRERCENPVEKVITTGLIIGLANHTALIRKNGTEIVIEDSAAPVMDSRSKIVGTVLVFRDVTEKHRLETELLKIEKLESVGLLAGGIAHDFNNLLTSIVGNISLAKMHLDPGNTAYDRMTEAENASRRATDLTQQLLTFSRGGAPVRKAASIVDIIAESASFTLSGTNVAPTLCVSEDIWNVDVDAGQMSQVFNNLIINAVHAMPRGGNIFFVVSNVILSEDAPPNLKEGRYARITVRDEGLGIPPAQLDHIFDPYFTTKQSGSGLGLTSVYSIIKRHDGHITVESAPSIGTTFDIYLPASQSAPAQRPASDAKAAAGTGTVLVMDDEPLVRDISGSMLSSLGYNVALARHGAEAIEMYRKALNNGTPYDAIIMDLTIPGAMGGGEAIRELLALDPNVRAIVSSGYSNDPIMANFREYGFKGVMTKPYNLGNLGRTLTEILKE